MTSIDLTTSGEVTFRRNFLLAALASGLVLCGLFSIFPGIDIAVSSALRSACGGDDRHSGWCHENGLLMVPRYLAIAFTVLTCAATLYIAMRTFRQTAPAAPFVRARCLFLLVAIAIGPGLLANVILKDHWGRARPREVVQFGGTKTFTPPHVPSNECQDNCSFVSGEAAAVYTPFFAAALLFPQVRFALLSGGVLAGVAAGLVRVSTGGHFLSDILFAGVFMALMVAVTYAVMFGVRERLKVASVSPLEPSLGSGWNAGFFTAANEVRGKQ